MKKRWLSVLSVISLGLLLTACGSGESKVKGETDTKEDKGMELLGDNVKFDPNKLVNEGKPVEIEYWTWGDNDPVITLAKSYEDIYPNVTIKTVIQPWDDMWKKLPLQLKGKNGPAIFNVHNSQHDILIPYMAPYDVATEDLSSDFSHVESHIIDGKVYYIDSAVNTGNIYYNKKHWEEAGLTESDIPVTWDEFREVGKKLTKTDDKGKITQAGFNYNGSAGYNALIMGLNYQKGQVMFDENNKTLFDNDTTTENTQFMVDLYDVDKIGSKDFGDDATMSFGNEQTSMVYRWGWMAGELENKYPDVDYGVFGTPTPSSDVPFAYDRFNGESTPGINKNQTEEQQKVAQDFLTYLLANDDYSKIMAFNNASFPTKKSLANDSEIMSHPVLSVIGPRMERLIWPGPFPSAIETVSQQVIENIMYNGKPISDAISEGQKQIDKDTEKSKFKSLENKYKFYETKK